IKAGIDFEREAFHQDVQHHDYQVLRADNTVARYVTFIGPPFQQRKNFDAAQYAQDRWTPRDGLLIEGGIRAEWNEIVRRLEWSPRLAAVWAPGRLHNTKISAGYGIFYDRINLGIITPQHQVSFSTFFAPAGGPPKSAPIPIGFFINEQALR